MHLYVFVCKNLTNIWAGIGARAWAVSEADPSIMKARKTRAQNIKIGQYGIIYCSDETALTTPFLITSMPNADKKIEKIWPEVWSMPFGIHPLGTPRKLWNAHEAAAKLTFNTDKSNTNIASVFKAVGTAVFSPIDINEADWAMILDKLGDIAPTN